MQGGGIILVGWIDGVWEWHELGEDLESRGKEGRADFFAPGPKDRPNLGHGMAGAWAFSTRGA